MMIVLTVVVLRMMTMMMLLGLVALARRFGVIVVVFIIILFVWKRAHASRIGPTQLLPLLETAQSRTFGHALANQAPRKGNVSVFHHPTEVAHVGVGSGAQLTKEK
jgi:hypothetical protein